MNMFIYTYTYTYTYSSLYLDAGRAYEIRNWDICEFRVARTSFRVPFCARVSQVRQPCSDVTREMYQSLSLSSTRLMLSPKLLK